MRPIEKKQPNDVLQLEDGSLHTISTIYNPYQSAKPVLIANIGKYCSYCEDAYHQDRDLHVEHVQPKGLPKYAHLRYAWDNFLLSCSTCNGTDNKGNKNVILNEIHLPHRNNTFLSLCYKPGGVVIANPALTGLSLQHATNLLNLTGLGKPPANSSPGDKRWMKRSHDWDIAQRYRNKYENRKCDIETIVDLVTKGGGWSIWFTVFQEHDEVRKALIEKIPGTCATCFDAQQHYNPIERNPGESDPV